MGGACCYGDILLYTADPEQLTSETPDIELMWNIQLLSRVRHSLTHSPTHSPTLRYLVLVVVYP